jgi:hypothetical protein
MRSNLASSVLVLLALSSLAAGCSCGDGGTMTGNDSGTSPDATSGNDANVDTGPPGPDTGLDTGVDGGGSTNDVGTDAFVPECTAATDCDTVRGPAPCGVWTCPAGSCVAMCSGCTTDADGDGFGVGAGCAGPDCDDADPLLGANGSRSCYPAGSAGTPGVGVCRSGAQSCTGGVLGMCGGFVVPGGEACNGVDDDCDTMTDESLGMITCGQGACANSVSACGAGGALAMCTPGTGMANDTMCNGIDDDCDGLTDEDCTCLRVTTTGNDATGDGAAIPFLTIQRAIDYAVATPSAPRLVCVAAGAACGATATYAGDVTMSNGVSVYGRYESTGWTRCPNSTTAIVPVAAVGVSFGSSITTTTSIGGFRIDRATASTTAGITVDGATHVTIVDIAITNTPTVSSSYGINLINGAQATITRSNIFAGMGTAESIGVRSVGSTPTITFNCASLNAQGICDQYCGGTNPAIRGRTGSSTPGIGDTWAVLLDHSPNAIIETSAMCANDGDHGAGIRVTGDATGTVIRGNLVNAFGGALDSHGMWLDDCAGAAPWIVNNFLIAAVGDTVTTRVDGVRAIGDCHPVIESNVQITGGAEGGTTGANGVYCGANATGLASRCAVLDNPRIEGSARGFPPTAVGVRCDDGGCLRIEGNQITGRGGIDSWGIYLGVSGTFVDGNYVSGGCSTTSATGIYAAGSYARIQNNIVHGYDQAACGAGMTGNAHSSVGMHVVADASGNEVDVNGNTFEAHQGGFAACAAVGLWLEAAAGTTPGPHGVYRNDIFHAAGCGAGMNFDVREESATADPRIFTNDDLDPAGAGGPVLYVDEGTMSLSSAAMVNALTDATVNGVLSADPMFASFPTDLHIAAGSMCVGAGTATGAPADDYDGMPRAAPPAIGADQP